MFEVLKKWILDFPVVSGNVSFYNGTNKNIFPTPVMVVLV